MLPPTSTICSTVVASLTFTQLLGAASQLATADRPELPAVVRRRNTPCHFCSDSSSCPLDGLPGHVHGGADCRARCIYGCAGRRCGARSSCQRLDTAGSDKTRRSSCCASPGLTATGVRTLVPPYIRPSVPHTCLPFQKTTVADTCPPPPVTVRVSGLKLIHTATPDTTNCRRCELDSGQLKTVAHRKFEV